MADTDTETLPNGTGTLSPEEEERLKQRPADIDADVREMERRKRVEALMSSRLFREELERVLDQQIHEGNDAPLLQRIREMVGGRLHTGSLRGPSCVLPINDIRGIEGVGYEKGEKILRCKLAAAYRLVDLFGWTQTGIAGQITARLNTAVEQVLTTPRGLLPHEVTASSLVKVDMQGVVQDQGTTNFPVNVDGFSLHASVHAARPDVRCVLHVRSAAALAVSSTRRGLLPLSAEAALLGELAYHSPPYGPLDNAERDKLVRALGPHAKVLFLSCGGALCCGGTLEEAFHQARQLTAACDVQLRLATMPLDEIILIDEETRQKIYEASRTPPKDSNKWRVGGEEFEALMRMLDNAGFRTGYIYRNPLVKNDVPRPKNDVEVPPAVSSLGYLLEEEELYNKGIWKKGTGKAGERTRWLNSPNVYQKVEVLETGTSDPKKITKWVQDGSPAHSSTPVKIDTLQFVPKNTNPKEFKALQQQIKDNRRADKISAGPQSHILEGVTWDEAAKLVGEDAANTHTGDHVVLMGAASKGIIQRGYQHNATVYSAPYARNPFDQVSDRELDEYKRTVERRQRGNDYDTDISESEAISAAMITSPASATETEEESRDEARILRIETKQVPMRSQPEVVLSDVDTTDFLNAERSYADRTKADRDPNLLSDDEVFADSRQDPVRVVVRARTAAVQHPVVRGTNEARSPPKEALTVKKKTKYNRVANFNKVIEMYEKHNDDNVSDPKCKVSLHNRLSAQQIDVEPYETGNASSRSSLRSITSLEWDGRCKSEYVFRTRSLPRQRTSNTQNLYRTRSHSGFINSYIKYPDPNHFHLPKCRSCGTINNSYAWELIKENLAKTKVPMSMYFSVDDIQQKCIEEAPFEADLVKIKEKVLPVSTKVTRQETEFVDSQEFNEDNYLGDLGNSFSSENQTVIEQANVKKDCALPKSEVQEEQTRENYRDAVSPIVETEDVNNNTEESIEGEYHSFTDEIDFDEAAYISPVKDLVEKDIRDYSVPIKFYCDDYKKSCSPKKSPHKLHETPTKTVILEPILEESKVSDDSNTDNKSKVSYSGPDVTASERDKVDSVDAKEKISIENNNVSCPMNENEQIEFTKILESKKYEYNDIIRLSVFSNTSSAIDATSFNSTVEFEIFEIISDVVTSILNKIDFENKPVAFFDNIAQRNFETNFEVDSKKDNDLMKKYCNETEGETDSEGIKKSLDDEHRHVEIQGATESKSIVLTSKIYVETEVSVTFEENLAENSSKDVNTSDMFSASDSETFSIKKIIEELETPVNLNETVLTEVSESENQTIKIIQPILYHVFDRAYGVCSDKFKQNKKTKKLKTVVTVVDTEDILATAKSLWLSLENETEEYFNKELDYYFNKTEDNADLKNIESCLNGAVSDNFDSNDLGHNVQNTFCESTEICYEANIVYEEQDIKEIVNLCEELSFNEPQITDVDMNLSDSCHNKTIYDLSDNTTFDIAENLEENIEHKTEDETLLNETFTLDEKDEHMNTAFVDSVDSNQNSRIVFDCNESPIKKSKGNFVGDDLSVLYDKDDTIMGSPFVKKASVITMEQTEKTGGLKYWISFDENFKDEIKPTGVRLKSIDDTLPSFVCIDIDESETDVEAADVYFDDRRRSSVLDNVSLGINASSVSLEYNTCNSDILDSRNDTDEPQKMLIYDNRIVKSKTRRYSSWPPFEDTLFYKIISQFRMSESFDPNEFNELTASDGNLNVSVNCDEVNI
ncbi:uncharacterized protein LOC106138603 [Amyelois transitella]|uniref:uncharacterized protein LOC106138603 n=1 Tax=Amyelois transitella TaxID=680683 RepID=UPI00298FE9BB|nr:uncharacterized protein LOC106138603 [Amyelois transitella]